MNLWSCWILFVIISLSESAELTLKVVNQWPTYSMVDKLPYLLTEYDWNLYIQELQGIWNHSLTTGASPEQSSPLVTISQVALENFYLMSDNSFPDDFHRDLISESIFVNYHQEYQDLQKIHEFWSLCDDNRNNFLSLIEYVLCRGEVDQHGNLYDRNEFDFLEEALMKEFWEKVSSSDYQPEMYRYDEDGIIIDE
jgi:hypothetical protein